ncbi:MAG TPA: response regulator, partial [Candidatus Caenarcaniphilales bacterium]
GMDVVRTNLKQARGEIKVDTTLQVGTTFTLSVPFTLSVVRVLLVESNGMLLAFPTDAIEEMLLLKSEQIFTTAGSEVLNWEDSMVPLVRLGQRLAFYCPRKPADTEAVPIMNVPTVLIVGEGSQVVGIQVDRCWGEQEVAIRQVEGSIALPASFSSCTILGDGQVVPLVNAPALLQAIAQPDGSPHSSSRPVEPPLTSSSLEQVDPPTNPGLTSSRSRKDTILVIDDSINVRRFLALTLEKAGYQVEQAKDGQDAVEKLLSGLQVQAVTCDIEMPRLDGYGFLARIRANPAFQQLPIAMLTSRSGDKHRQLAMNLGATAYFSKPFKEQELIQTLQQLIQ